MNDQASAIDDQLGPWLEYFAERLNRVFAYHFCVFEFREEPAMRADPSGDARAWAVQTINNACLHESLIAIRDIDDFLSPRSAATRSEDLRASDFGYPRNGKFLSQSERESIHKLIVHSTTVGAASDQFRWDIWGLSTKSVEQAVNFLTWIESNRVGFRLWSAALICRNRTQKIHDWAAREIEARRTRNSH